MVYRRHEGFRYTFNKPVDCSFKIIKMDDEPIETDFGNAHIIDISPNGLKMLTTLNLLPTLKKVEIEIHFTFEEQFLQVPGLVVWQKRVFQNNQFYYGIRFNSTNDLRNKIIEMLKIHTQKLFNEELNSSNHHLVKYKTKKH